MSIVLSGYKAAGKTTVAATLGSKYGFNVVEFDELIRQNHDEKKSIGQIYQELGVKAFRELESFVLNSLEPAEKTVFSTSGGVVLHPANLVALKLLGKIFYLKVAKSELSSRISKIQPLPLVCQNLAEYLTSRDYLYESSADIIIEASDKSVHEITETVYRIWSINGI